MNSAFMRSQSNFFPLINGGPIMCKWILLPFLVLMHAYAARANEVGNGGDYVAAEFIARAHVVLAKMQANSDNLITPEQVQNLGVAILEAGVESSDAPIMDHFGRRVDARVIDDPANPGKKLIQLDRERWLQYLASRENIYRLVFHEYLWVIGLDDTNYRISIHLNVDDTLSIESRACGLDGSMTERITACARDVIDGGFGPLATKVITVPRNDPLGTGEVPEVYTWRLVSRTPGKLQVWYDEHNQLVWTDLTSGSQPYGDANGLCRSSDSPLKASIALNFRIPTRPDYERSVEDGLLSVFGRKGKAWTSSDFRPGGGLDTSYYVHHEGTWPSTDNGFSWAFESDYRFTRCVADWLR
jgi:hypothetical protein